MELPIRGEQLKPHETATSASQKQPGWPDCTAQTGQCPEKPTGEGAELTAAGGLETWLTAEKPLQGSAEGGWQGGDSAV